MPLQEQHKTTQMQDFSFEAPYVLSYKILLFPQIKCGLSCSYEGCWSSLHTIVYHPVSCVPTERLQCLRECISRVVQHHAHELNQSRHPRLRSDNLICDTNHHFRSIRGFWRRDAPRRYQLWRRRNFRRQAGRE